MTPDHVSAVADVVMAAGSLGALAAAVWAGRVAWRTFQQQQEQLLIGREQLAIEAAIREEEFASRFDVWCEFHPDLDKYPNECVQVWYFNGNPVSIRDVEITLRAYDRDRGKYVSRHENIPVLPPTVEARRLPVVESAAQDLDLFGIDAEPSANLFMQTGIFGEHLFSMPVEFTDPRGQRWCRRADGVLERRASDAPRVESVETGEG